MTYTANRIDEIIEKVRIYQDQISFMETKVFNAKKHIRDMQARGYVKGFELSQEIVENGMRAIRNCEDKIRALKAELISPEFRKNVDPEAIVIVSVKFGKNSETVDYRWKNEQRVLVGDTVKIVSKNGEYRIAEVVNVIVVQNTEEAWAEHC